MIVGITGKYCSGKDTIAEYLTTKGFIHYSLSNEIRTELKERGMEISRENLINVGNELRRKQGNGILAQRVLRKILNENYVVSSIRNLEEVKTLQNREDFILVFVDAPLEKRFQRIVKRDREGDIKTFKEFKEREKSEMSRDPSAQHLHKTIKFARIVINNDSTIEDLKTKVDTLIYDLLRNRPVKERYYLNIAREVSKRSTCFSIQFGAIIVRDDQIISTGYVGSPRKTMDCFERGFCLRRKLDIPSGQRYELCRSVHAEMNVIINAARAGVSLLGGDMYVHGIRVYEGKNEMIKMQPCFICKKLIINAGIKRFITHDEYGKIMAYNIEKDWVEKWRRADMLDDKEVYDAGKYTKS